VGFGSIGRRVAAFASCLELRVAYHDAADRSKEAAALGARSMPFRELLEAADVVSLHVPLAPATRHLVGEDELHAMRPTAFLVNTSRGAVVDQRALERALVDGRIAGAALDVLDPEPPEAGSTLLSMPNVIVTPHMAAHTAEAMRAMATVVDDVLAVLRGQLPVHPVEPPGEGPS
jgi:phosphoglycerate dehydrogenase-like enzyme